MDKELNISDATTSRTENQVHSSRYFEGLNSFYHIVARVLSFQEVLKMRIVVSKMIVSYKKENECDFIKLIEILTFSIVQVVMLKYFLALGQRSKYHLEIFKN